MHWLVTGGAGFIGSYLSEALLERGDEVDVIDDLSTGQYKNIEHLEKNSRFTFIFGSILKEDVLDTYIQNCDGVFHLAASVGVRLIISEPIRTIETNILGTRAVLNVADVYKCKVLLASTSEVYGKNTNVPFTEEHDSVFGNAQKSRWSYACSKAIDEFLALAYLKESNLPIVIIRYFNVIGPKQTGQYGMVVPRFIEKALENEPIPVYGDGNQSRCFLDIRDAVDATIKLMECQEAIGQVFNLGNDNEISIAELARKIKELTKSQSTIDFIPYEQAYEKGFEDMRQRIPNINKIKQFIGFTSKYDLDSTLKFIIKN